MQAKIAVFIESLMSRKFILTVVGAFALYTSKQYTELVVLILGYLGVEGGADLVSRYKTRNLTARDIENAVSQNIDEGVDTSKIVSGKDTPLFNEEDKTE